VAHDLRGLQGTVRSGSRAALQRGRVQVCSLPDTRPSLNAAAGRELQRADKNFWEIALWAELASQSGFLGSKTKPDQQLSAWKGLVSVLGLELRTL
jgi:hypothetical protein